MRFNGKIYGSKKSELFIYLDGVKTVISNRACDFYESLHKAEDKYEACLIARFENSEKFIDILENGEFITGEVESDGFKFEYGYVSLGTEKVACFLNRNNNPIVGRNLEKFERFLSEYVYNKEVK